ncbi:Ig-like domain-containing protein [Cohnella fermenti]|nr:Ig-like domain-containing protein [Cohnella fermenti]
MADERKSLRRQEKEPHTSHVLQASRKQAPPLSLLRKAMIALLLLALAIPTLAAGAETLTTEQKYEALKAQGIFTGLGDGSAGLNQSMTREQFAAVLFRLWGLTDASPAKGSFDDVLKTRWSYAEVEAVSKAGLMNGTGSRQFQPAARVTIEQLAAVLVRAYGYTGAGSTSVKGKTSLWARGSVSQALDRGFIPVQSDYTIAATRGLLAEAAYTAYTELNSLKLQVSAVQPLANSVIQVTLKQAASKVNMSSFSLKDDQGTAIAIRSATLSSDGRVVTVSTGPQQGDVIYTLTVDGTGWRYSALWASGSGGTTPVGDTTRPTVVSLENIGDRMLRLTFSEQVSRTTAEDPDHYGIVSGKLALYGFKLSDDLRSVIIATGGQEDGYRYRLSAAGVKDLSGNAMNARDDLYFYGIDDDHSKPTVVSVAGKNDSTIQVVFSERVDESDAKNVRNYSVNNGLRLTRATLAADGKTVALTTSEQTDGQEYKLTVKGIADLSGNVMNTQKDIVFKGVNDHVKPYIVSVDVLGDSTVQLRFSEKINADQAKNVGYYSIDKGLRVTNAIVTGSGDTVVLTTTRQTDAVLYTLTVQGISDLAGNTMDTASNLIFGGYVDRDAPTVVGIRNTARQVVLTFSERLDYGSAASVGNYRFEGGLGAVRGAAYDDGKKTVTLTTDAQTPGSVYAVVVNQVRDLSGNPIAADTRIQFVGSGQETAGSIALQKLEVVDQNTVAATFSRALYDANVASLDLTILKDNGRDVDVSGWSEYVVRKPGTDNTVLIQLRTKASGNPALFLPGHAYIGRITDLEGLATENGANEKAFAGTEKKNEAPYATTASALNSTAVKVAFSEPVRGIRASEFLLLRDDDSEIGIGGVSVNEDSLVTEAVLYLDDKLQSGKTYSLRFKDGIKDGAGWNAIKTTNGSKPYEVVLAGTSAANEAPRVTGIASKDKIAFAIEFSEPVRLDDARGFRLFRVSNGEEIRIRPNEEAIYALSSDRKSIGVYLNVDRLDPLRAGERYRLEYDAGTGRVTDDQGATLSGSDNGGVYLFNASGAENARPAIAKVDARGTTLAIAFGEPIQGYSGQTDLFRIVVDGQEVKPSEGRIDGQTIVLKVPSLPSGKIGTIELADAGVSAIRDYNNQSPSRDITFTFGVQ